MIGRRYLCPCCHGDVKPTMKGNIMRHMDGIREHVCPASDYPFYISVISDPEFQGVQS